MTENAYTSGREAFRWLSALILVALIGYGQSALAGSAISISFDGYEVGKPPTGWVSRNGNLENVYSVHADDSGKFLHADAQGTGVQIGIERKWPIQEFPVVEWRWRAVQFPLHTDERKKSGDDSVLSLYVIFGTPPFYHAIKYIWRENLPVGTSFDSPYSSRTKMVVVESGRTFAGRWITEKRNVLSDYRRLFNTAEMPQPSGIGVLTDGDNTRSRAIGDYGPIDITPLTQTARKGVEG